MEEKNMLLEVYSKDNNPDSHVEPLPGEPGLLFHEFLFLLAMIALNAETLSPVPHKQIELFFVNKLEFTMAASEGREYKTFDHYLANAQCRAAGLEPVNGSDVEDEDDLYGLSDEGEDEMDKFEID